MCLILIAYKTHPQFDFVVAANRDEFYQRPSRAAGFWPEQPQILAGQDEEAGGTWLGVTRQGRFAAITNYRDGSADTASKRSRGELTRDFLASTTPPLQYAEQIMAAANHYRGFNLFVGDSNSLAYCNNQTGNTESLAPGIYGLSNHLLDTPWPKVIRGKKNLAAVIDKISKPADSISADYQSLSESLFTILRDDAIAADDELPNTGIDLERERLLSPLFIRTTQYGTVNSTTVFVEAKNNKNAKIYFRERSFYQPTPTDVAYEIKIDDEK